MPQIDILTRKIWWPMYLLMNLDALVVELNHNEDKIVIDDMVAMLPDAVDMRLT
jgi:hypothetical protein